MTREPGWAAYWQGLHAAQVRGQPRRLPRRWLDAAFLYAPDRRSVGPRGLAHRLLGRMRSQ